MEAGTSRSWQDVLLAGLGGIIDSQRAVDYSVSDPRYSTAAGLGGQSQRTAQGAIAQTSPVVWIVGAVAVLGVVLLLARR
jgi:hypothetical protein